MLTELALLIVCVFFFVLMIVGIAIENWLVAGFGALVILRLIWMMLNER